MVGIVKPVSVGAEGEEHSSEVMRIARPDDLTDLASLGLTMAEGKNYRKWEGSSDEDQKSAVLGDHGH